MASEEDGLQYIYLRDLSVWCFDVTVVAVVVVG